MSYVPVAGDLRECQVCGAVIRDTERHDAWHLAEAERRPAKKKYEPMCACGGWASHCVGPP